MRLFIKLVVIGGFIGWYKCFGGVLDFNCIVPEFVLKSIVFIYIYIYIAEMQKRKRPILCYSEFCAKALVRQTITETQSELH